MTSSFARKIVLTTLLALPSVAGCGGQLEPEEHPNAGLIDALEARRKGAQGQSSRTFIEQCYVPGEEGNPGAPCLRTEDPRLPGLFRECRAPEEIRGDPIYDVNVTTGAVRCCYEVSDESCTF